MKAQKVFKTEDNTILIVKVSTDGCNGRQYVSVTADEITPRYKSEVIEEQMEYLEDGEYWRQAVAAEQTELSLTDWIGQFSEKDLIEMADRSLYDEELNINGKDIVFVSGSCGCLHDEIKAVSKEFNKLIDMHLSSDLKDISTTEKFILTLQKTDVDVDFEVEKLTREILELI